MRRPACRSSRSSSAAEASISLNDAVMHLSGGTCGTMDVAAISACGLPSVDTAVGPEATGIDAGAASRAAVDAEVSPRTAGSAEGTMAPAPLAAKGLDPTTASAAAIADAAGRTVPDSGLHAATEASFCIHNASSQHETGRRAPKRADTKMTSCTDVPWPASQLPGTTKAQTCF